MNTLIIKKIWRDRQNISIKQSFKWNKNRVQ